MAFKERPTSFDYPVIDADGHIFEDPKIFNEYLPAKWREDAKQKLISSGSALGMVALGNKTTVGNRYRLHMSTAEAYQETLKKPDTETWCYEAPGIYDPEVRLWCMDEEGIDRTIIRGTQIGHLPHQPMEDEPLVEAICIAYNDYLRDYCNADPTRLFPEPCLPRDPDKAIKEMERVAKLGFVGLCMRGSTAGVPLSDPCYDPVFARAQEYGWPLCIHAAFDGTIPTTGAGVLLSDQLQNTYSAGAFFSEFVHINFMLDNIMTLGEITLGGMCDKFPKLNVYFIESGHSWLGECLYRFDKGFESPFAGVPANAFWASGREIRGKTLPSEIFKRQIFCQFEGGDELTEYSQRGMEKLSKNLIWASDIPHFDADGPWEGVGALRAMNVSRKVETAIMGENFSRISGIPCSKAVGTSKRTKAAA